MVGDQNRDQGVLDILKIFLAVLVLVTMAGALDQGDYAKVLIDIGGDEITLTGKVT